MKKEAKKETEILEGLARELLEGMGVTVKIDVSEDKDNEAFVVNINSDEEQGLLIGKKGETVTAIQTALSLMFKQNFGDWKRVVVNVGDYMEKQEEYLRSLAERTVERVRETGEAQSLYNLKPAQRRIVHMVIQEIEGVVSESTGEGSERCLVVKPDASK